MHKQHTVREVAVHMEKIDCCSIHGVHGIFCIDVKAFNMHVLDIWKLYQVYFPMDPMAHHSEFFFTSNCKMKICCASRLVDAQVAALMMIMGLARYVWMEFYYLKAHIGLGRSPPTTSSRIEAFQSNEFLK
jgi:hypothetical protein